tara:strand:+ start:254 stop:1183 length:930 start_codon:yes stop_codon:yes gene_type:complete
MREKSKKIINYGILSVIIIIVPILITEFYLQYIGLGKPIRYDDNYVYGFSPKINQKSKRFNNSTITINDVGLRSIHDWSQNNDKLKVVFFGDSVTYGGSYIDDKETFSHLVCENIKKKDVVCGNAGVNAYGIYNIAYRSKYDNRIKPIFLRIFILIPDDFYRGLQNYKTAHFYMNNQKFIFPAIFEALNFISTKYNLKNFISKKKDNQNYSNKNELIKESVIVLLDEFNRLDKKNKNFLVFYLPSKYNNDLDKKIYQSIKEKINFKIINLSNSIQKNMYHDSIHLNRLGHEKISLEISKEIYNNFFKKD